MSINDDGGHRIIFPPGEQGKYLRTVRAHLGLISWKALAKQCDCAERNMYEWAAERKHSMPARVVGVLHRLSGVAPPRGELISATRAVQFSRGHPQSRD